MLKQNLLYLSALLFLVSTGCISADRGSSSSSSDVEERLAALEDADLNSRLTTVEESLAGQAQSLETLQGDVEGNSATLATNGESIAQNQATATSQANDITTLQDNLDELDAEVVAVADLASLLETEVALNTSSLSTLDGNLSALEGLVDDHVPVRTTVSYGGYVSGNPGTTLTELRTLGNFTKVLDSTDIKLTWVSHVSGSGGNSGHCNFQPRIDGSAGNNGYGAIIADSSTAAAVVVAQTYTGLSAGTHTISLWARSTAVANSCADNPGNYPRNVYIEEGPGN